MKRLLFPLLLLPLLFGCAKSFPESTDPFANNPDLTDITTEISGIRSTEQIREIALQAVQDFSSSIKTKSSVRNKEIKNIIPSTIQTKSGDEDPLFYVVNFTGDNGFVIVGADVNSPEVIVYTEKGYYDGNSSQNEGFNIYMDDMSSELAGLRSHPGGGGGPIGPGIMYTEIDTSTTFTTINPLVEVQWDDSQYPFKWFCYDSLGHRVSAGCVAIAMGQIMSFHESPSSITITFPGADSTSVSLNWAEMKLPLHSELHFAACPYCFQNAYLIREIGERVNMRYNVNGSEAYTIDVPDAFDSFNYSCSLPTSYNLSSIQNNIYADKPVFIGGSDSLLLPGHAWIADGLKISDFNRKVYNVTPPFSRVLVLDEHIVNTYLHFNYGWGGTDDGYYLAKQREYGQGSLISGGSYDNITVSMFTGIGYNQIVKIITDIQPQQ